MGFCMRKAAPLEEGGKLVGALLCRSPPSLPIMGLSVLLTASSPASSCAPPPTPLGSPDSGAHSPLERLLPPLLLLRPPLLCLTVAPGGACVSLVRLSPSGVKYTLSMESTL